MVLTIDCGNTMIKFGLFEGDDLKEAFSITTDKNKSSDEYAFIMDSFLKDKKCLIEGAIISSVVPQLNDCLSRAIKKIFHINVLIVGKGIKTKIAIKIDNPSELGSDMLCGAIGALKLFKAPVVVADLGTATKLYVVDNKNSFIGCVITTGIRASLKSLVSSTSMLLEVPLEFPKKIIGKNTKDSIQSGILNSQKYTIESFSLAMENELNCNLKKIITGGFSGLLASKMPDFECVENLILIGLNEIYKVNNNEKK